MNKMMKACGRIISKGAIAVAVLEANLACPWIHYQPELPDSVKKFSKYYAGDTNRGNNIDHEVNAAKNNM